MGIIYGSGDDPASVTKATGNDPASNAKSAGTDPASMVRGTIAGPQSPGTVDADFSKLMGQLPWTTWDNAKVSDDNYAECVANSTEYSKSIDATNFGFNIPSTATIRGIQVDIERKRTQGTGGQAVKDYRVSIIKSDGSVGDNDKKLTAEWPLADTSQQYGGSSDLWGEAWTPTTINSANFGVVLQVQGTSPLGDCTAMVDHFRIRVWYDYP